MADFVDIPFPLSIAYGSKGGAEFNTSVVSAAGGAIYRNRKWRNERQRWNVAPGIKELALALELEAFFRARGGQAQGFLFRDPRDYSATADIFAIGDGTTQLFQLFKTYKSGPETYWRKITKPKAGIQLFLDGVLVTSGVTVSTVLGVDPWLPLATGLIEFDVPPGEGVEISATYEFYVAVIFGIDYLPMQFEDRSTQKGFYLESDDIPLIEDRTA